MEWQQGKAVIDGLVRAGRLERVPENPEHAETLLSQAHKHVEAAEAVVQTDPVGAFQLLYDAARKALCAVLERQGLRATSRGGHLAVAEAALAQLDPPHGEALRPFDRMRRRRNEAEYPRPDVPGFLAADVLDDVPKVRQILDTAQRVLVEMTAF